MKIQGLESTAVAGVTSKVKKWLIFLILVQLLRKRLLSRMNNTLSVSMEWEHCSVQIKEYV